jgi:hypothetical protein
MQCAHNVTLKSVRVTIDAVEEQRITFSVCVHNPSYPRIKAHVPYYIVICDLSDSTKFFHIFSLTA